MRKLKLQVQISVDGCVAGPNGELDWMTWEKDERLIKFINDLTDSSSTIILGRKMTDGFMNYWEGVIKNQPDSPEFSFAKKMVDTPKVVFTKTLDKSPWTNTTLAKGNLADEIAKLKKQEGKDIVVYGGAGFVSSLIKENLIDEFNFFVNPVMIGKGMRIFDLLGRREKLTSLGATGYSEGISVLRYKLGND
ncbi:MAG: dihydrofolate reductase family protein [Cyclobacteriaceae bacterium]